MMEKSRTPAPARNSDLFYRYQSAAADATAVVQEPVEEKPAEEKPRVTAVDLEREIERLREEEIVTAEEAAWLKAVFLEFGLLPHEVLGFREKTYFERINVLKKARVNLERLKESWITTWQLEREKVKIRDVPARYTGTYIAKRAIELGLVEPVLLRFSKSSEYGLRVGRMVLPDKELEKVAYVLSNAGGTYYTPSQLFNPILASLKAGVKTIPKEYVDPLSLLNLENGVVDLELLEPAQADGAVFTYELPPVSPVFLERLRKGEISEEYFAARPFYLVLRKHYNAKEWEKLKYVLGATIVPRTMKLIAIIVGEKNTRKTFLSTLIKKTLRGLAAPISLKQVLNEENRFSLEHAIFARVLIASEQARTIVESVETLKRLSGGDPIVIDRKFKEPFVREETPYKIFIFTNDLPQFKRWDEAFVDRLVIIQPENPQLPDVEEQRLIDKAKEKPEEFLEFILWCYWQLRKSNYAIPEKGDPSYVELLLEAQSNVHTFLKELESGLELNGRKYSVFFSPGLKTEAARLYDVYLEWCLAKGERAQGRINFYRLVERSWRKEKVFKMKLEEGVVFRGVYLQEKAAGDTGLEDI